MPYDDNNIFARILRGEIPAKTIDENDHAVAFHDVHPQSPVHILVIPKGAYISIDDFGAKGSEAEIAGFYRLLSKVAKDHGLSEDGFRAIANAGVNGGQEVPHFHVHLVGGKKLGRMLPQQD